MDDAIDDAIERVDVWEEQATENVEKWGLQDVGSIILAIAEENGEVADDASEILATDEPALATLLDSVEAAGLTVRDGLERVAEDEAGEPVEDRPTFSIDEEADIEELQAEIDDLGALVIQLQAAMEQANTGEGED